MVVIIVVLWMAICTQGAQAAKTIYRCDKGGQIVLTDQPCDGTKPAEANSTTIPSTTHPSTVGVWRGQMQYSGTEVGEMIATAHAVVPLTLDFTQDGKVSGSSPENGCEWLGVWSQSGAPVDRIITLDVSLTSCHYSGFHRRYTGTFLLGVPDSSGVVNLLAYTSPLLGQKIRAFSLGGTLRRQ